MNYSNNTPAFSIRGFNLCESILRHTPDQLRNFIRRMKLLRMNTIIIHYDYGWQRYKNIILEETQNAGIEITLMTFGPRTFWGYTDWEKDWFAKQTNGESFTGSLECETHPCRYNQEGLEAFKAGARSWLKQLPSQIKRVHMRAADGLKFCQCPKCRNLLEQEKWQPFVDAFVEAVNEVRPNIGFEADIYVKRYNLPKDISSHLQMERIMYDTFYRHNLTPIGIESPNRELVYNAASEKNPDAKSPNTYHANRLREWISHVPQKVYIHENTMSQILQGVFQYNTGILLEDLLLYKKLGIQGVCYEAYEPGYVNFADNFTILADALINIDRVSEYQLPPLELALQNTPDMDFFCSDMNFSLDKYIKDDISLRHIKHFQKNWFSPDALSYKEYIDFAMSHEETLDFIYIGFFNAKWGMRKGKLDFSGSSDEAQYMLGHTKLWDFMEKLPLTDNPVSKCKQLIINLRECVRSI